MHKLLVRIRVKSAVRRARRLLDRDQTEAASAFAAEAYEWATKHLEPLDSEYVLAISTMATVRFHDNDIPGAIELLEAVAPRVDTVLAEQPAERHAVLNNLAICYGRLGRAHESIDLMKRVIADKAKTYGDLSSELLGNLQDLVVALDSADRFAEAEDPIRQMLAIIGIELGEASREYVQMLGNLAACLGSAGKKREQNQVLARAKTLAGAADTSRKQEELEREVRKAYDASDFPRARRLHRALLARTPSSPFPSIFTAVMGDVFDPMVHHASTLDEQGVEAERRGDFAEAIRLYRIVLEIFNVSSDDHGLHRARALSNLALAHQHAGELDVARNLLLEAVSTIRPLLDVDVGKQIVANVVNLFNALADRDAPDPNTNLGAAIDVFRNMAKGKEQDYARSLRIRFPVPQPGTDRVDEFSRWIQARIVFYLSYGAVDPARALHQHLLDLHEILLPTAPARVLQQVLSFVAFSVQYGPAVKTRSLLTRASELSEELLGANPGLVAETLRWEGRFRSSLSDDIGAEEALFSARELLSDNSSEAALAQHIDDDLLIVSLRLGRTGPTVDALLESAIKRQTAELDINDAEAIQRLADLLSYRKEWKRAEELYRKALVKQAETIGEWDPRYALTLSNLASLLRMIGKSAEAVPICRQVVEVREREFGRHHESVVAARIRLALALSGIQDWTNALHEMRRVLEASNLFLQSTAAVTSRDQLFRVLRKERTTLDVFISIALKQPHPGAAARLIYDAILRRKGLAAEAMVARRLPILDTKHTDQKGLVTELAEISSIISEALISACHSDVDLREARARKQQLETILGETVHEVHLGQIWRSATVDDIQGALDERSMLLEFAQYKPFNFSGTVANGDPEFLPSRYLAFTLTSRSELSMIDVGEASVVDAAVGKLGELLAGDAGALRQLSADDRDAGDASLSTGDTIRAVGKELYRLVLDPLCRNLTEHEHILVAPDGILGLLPFDLLPIDDERLLLDACLVSNLGSGRDVVRLRAATSLAPTESVVICAPDFDSAGRTDAAVGDRLSGAIDEESQNTPELARSIKSHGINRIVPLPGAREEGHEIHRLLHPSRLFAGAAASKGLVRSLRSPLILHAATHAFAAVNDEEPPDNIDELFGCGLVLAGANAALSGREIDSELGDGFLSGEEAASLQLANTELVVLSACRSGFGGAVVGEGVFGLHRAFFVAGARSVITTLWKIPDAPTKDLMVAFYRELTRGASRVSALRTAKIEMRARHGHPYFWGSFLCHGDWRPVEMFNPSRA